MKSSGTTEIISHSGEFHSDRLRSLLRSAGDNKFGIITVVGDYQIGKSTLLKKLTGSESFKVGNGTVSETTGAQMSEAIMLSDIYERFNIEKTDDSKQALFFVDTEGTGSEGMTEEVWRKVIVPFISVSSVILVMLDQNTAISLLGVLGEIVKCGKLFNTKFSPKIVFCIRTNGRMIGGGGYKGITKEEFVEYQKYYRMLKKEVIGDINDPKICPIPNIQDEEDDYEAGMKLVAEEIVKAFDESQRFTKQNIETIIRASGLISSNGCSLSEAIQQTGPFMKSCANESRDSKSVRTVECIVSEKKELINSIKTVGLIDAHIDGIVDEATNEIRSISSDEAVVKQIALSLKKEGFNRIVKLMIDELTLKADDLLNFYMRISQNHEYIAAHKDADISSFSDAANSCFGELERRWNDLSIPGRPYELYREVFNIEERVKNEIEQ